MGPASASARGKSADGQDEGCVSKYFKRCAKSNFFLNANTSTSCYSKCSPQTSSTYSMDITREPVRNAESQAHLQSQESSSAFWQDLHGIRVHSRVGELQVRRISNILSFHSCRVSPTHSSAGKESTCNAGDPGLIHGLERSPGEGKGYPLQYSCLENSMDCIVHGVEKSQTQLSDFHFHFQGVLHSQ